MLCKPAFVCWKKEINHLILSYLILHGDERHIHYIEQIIYENTHIQQLMFNKNLMKRNNAITKNDFMRK